MNIVDPVLAQCRYQPDALALCVPGGHHTVISYGQLGKMIHNAGRYARHVGLSPGQVAVIFTDDQILHASLILGLAKIGVVTVSGRNPELPIELKIDAIIADYSRIFSRQIRVIPANFSWTAGDGTPVEEGRAGSGDEVCRLIFTSGTTGDAKAVAYTHRMVTERIVRFDYLAGNLFAAQLRTYVDLGFATSLGYLFLIRTLTRGGMLLLSAMSYESAMSACEQYRVESWVGAPGSLLSFLDYYDQSGGRRCAFQVMLAGGSLLSKSLSERVRMRMCSNLIAAYGSTETKPGCSCRFGQLRQAAAVDLAHLVLGKGLCPDEAARHEIGGKPLLAMDVELRLVDCRGRGNHLSLIHI